MAAAEFRKYVDKRSKFDTGMFASTARLQFVGFDDSKPGSHIAHIKIPLMHVGPNAKGLYWTPEVLKRIAPMFSNVAFKYDIGGVEGSSHVPDKLYSPHFDVGWTSKAYYDNKSQTLWVEGDVTHPEPLDKLQRVTSDGKRELNYASMGVLIDPDDVICSVCGAKMTDCDHKRNEVYDGKIAYAIPTDVEKALHVALTNAPADTEAVIAQAIFQENKLLRGETMANTGPAGGTPDTYTNAEGKRPNILDKRQVQPQQTVAIEQYQKDQAGESMHSMNPVDTKAKTNDAVSAMQADEMGGESAMPPDATSGAAPEGGDQDVEIVDVLKAIIMRLKALEEKLGGGAAAGGAAPMGGAPPEAPTAPAPEMQDIAGKYYKKMLTEVADKAVNIGKFKTAREAVAEYSDMSVAQLETLSAAYTGIPARKVVVETANVPEYGSMATTVHEKAFADMTPAERKGKYGEFGAWDGCFRPQTR